jgi:hypothetical protein
MNREQKLQALRILRAARVNEPTTMTAPRKAVYRDLLSRNLVVPSGERRGAVLCRLTKAGEDELRVLTAEVGELQPDYATKTVVRRATGDRGADVGDLPEGIEG